MTDTEERIEMRVNRLAFVKLIESRGYKTIAGFAAAVNLPYDLVYQTISQGSGNFSSGTWTPTANEIAATLDMLPEEVFGKHPMVDEAHAAAGTVFERGAPVHEDLGALLPAARIPSPHDAAVQTDLHRDVGTVLNALEPREERIIRHVHGIGTPELNKEETADVFGVTGTRIGQITDKSLRRLKHPSRSAKLRRHIL